MKRAKIILGLGVAWLGLFAGPAGAQGQTGTGSGQTRPAADTTQDPTVEGRLSLSAVYAVARERNPTLRAAAASVDATAARESAAGLPPDPTLQLAVMNFSIPGLQANMPNSMAPSIQAMQMWPVGGKLGLRSTLAEQSTAMARADADERWWEVRAAAARAFFTLHEIDRKLEVARETLALLEDFRAVAQSMYASGTGRQSDVLRANVEVARLDADIQRMEAMRSVAAARLNAVLNRPSETPVPATADPVLPSEWPDAPTLRSWAEETRPLLERSRTGV